MNTVDFWKSPTDLMEKHGFRCRCNRCFECHATVGRTVNGVAYCNITATELALTYLHTLFTRKTIYKKI